jgi:hypothetical protein
MSGGAPVAHALSDEDMWNLLGCVVTHEEGGRLFAGPSPQEAVLEAERAGYLWLRQEQGGGYRVELTPLGCAMAHKWAARKAKEAAVAFGR